MGCTNNKNVLTNSINNVPNNDKTVFNFDKNGVEIDLSNNPTEYENFIKFCADNTFPNLEYLNLSNNNITDISELRVLKAPQLKKLDLRNNKLKNINILMELNYPLEELHLEGNDIDSIEFEQPFFKKLKNNEIIRKQMMSAVSTLKT